MNNLVPEGNVTAAATKPSGTTGDSEDEDSNLPLILGLTFFGVIAVS